ncbi:MAG: LysM peptidoglycan-binding domain-containing protein [Muribaculum sp.]
MISASFSTGINLSGADLPTKTINGKEYFYREVKSKETIYGITKELGITKADIIKYNPSVADGLRAGMTLYFPVDEMPNLGEATPGISSVSQPEDTDKPVRSRKNDKVHLVEKGETVYGISKHYGITQSELIEANPQIKTGLKRGTILHIPTPDNEATVDDNTDTELPAETARPVEEAPTTEDQPEYVQEEEAAAEPADTASTDSDDSLLALLNPSADSTATADVEKEATEVAVILPFMLGQTSPDKQAQLYTEFYKGLLVAADSLRDSKRHIVIRAYDSANNTDSVKSILARPEMTGADIIITPDNDEQLNLIAEYATLHDAKVLNIFAVKGTQYLTNPNILQANIPHSSMYEQAINEFMNRNGEYIPVFLSALGGKTDKAEFCQMLRKRLDEEGQKYIDISYNNYLKASDLEKLDTSSSYVFIPESATSSEFSHIISALKNYREALDDYSLVRMFGYPEWITFRGDALDNLHLMNATVYSRFFNDNDSYRSKQFTELYVNRYGTPLMSAVPVQGMLGFDTGFYLIKAINRNYDNVGEPNYFYDGVQSGFHFTSPENVAGKVNDALYFINYRPSGITEKQAIQ